MNDAPIDREAAARSLTRGRRLKTFLVIVLVLIVAALTRGIVKSMLRSEPAVQAPQVAADPEPSKKPWELNWAKPPPTKP